MAVKFLFSGLEVCITSKLINVTIMIWKYYGQQQLLFLLSLVVQNYFYIYFYKWTSKYVANMLLACDRLKRNATLKHIVVQSKELYKPWILI